MIKFLKDLKMKPLDLVIIASLFLASFSVFFIFHEEEQGYFAQVRVDGKVLKTLNLKQDQTWTYADNGEQNIIEVKDKKVHVREANCPDKLDVRQGWISKVDQSIVCLPHQLVVEVISGDKQEGVDYQL
ncbi:NusG domain II-containing protein [Lactococcus termiticola]|uniref:Uncharacterized protein n=1 Tax=Lactococcus termiticola TaxID=2169526 RepID=A0A2R5HGG8_9LACT|nr:NusG domain II-containing protein [Lactococcus termiticola]GBG97157.1 hypothetical protein NtB2_01295 [Lactococcus termiticola]